MGCFTLDSSPDLFVVAPTPGWLWVWELNAPHSSGVEAKNWQLKAVVGSAKLGLEYTGLEIYGVKIECDSLLKLAEDLYASNLIVNYLGYSYLDTATIGDSSFSPQYYRLNDLFNWSKYSPRIDCRKVALSITSNTIVSFNWDRFNVCDGGHVMVSVRHQQAVVGGGGGGGAPYNQLKKKDARIAELEEELKTREKELQNCQTEIEELREENTIMICGTSNIKQEDLKKKVASLSANLMEKDAKISRLEASLRDCNAQVRVKDSELEEARERISSMTEALEKAEKTIIHKDNKIIELHEELERLKEKLSRFQQGGAGKEYNRSGSTKPGKPRRPQVENPDKVVEQRKRGVSQSSFEISDDPLPNRPALSGSGKNLHEFMPIDELLAGAGPRDIWVHVASGEFDPYSWRYIRVIDKDDGEDKMIAFYEGDHGSFKANGCTIHVPFKDLKDFTCVGEFFVAEIEGLGKRFAFLY